MSQTIEARVFQKKDTLANWNANPLIIGPGEQAFVMSDVDSALISYKVGNGIDRFSNLPWPDFTVRGKVTTSFVWTGAPSGIYLPVTAGTYNGVVVSLSDGYTILYWDGTTLIKVVYPLSIDLSTYALKTDLPVLTLSVGKNMVDTGNYSATGFGVNTTGFDIISVAGFRHCGYIKVTPGVQYTISNLGTMNKAIQYSDASKVKLTAAPGAVITTPTFTFTAPTGCQYVVFTVQVSGETLSPTIQMELGGSATAFTPFVPTTITAINGFKVIAGGLVSGALIGTDRVAGFADIAAANVLQNYYPENIFNKSDTGQLAYDGMGVFVSDGHIAALSGFKTRYADCKSLQQYTLSGLANTQKGITFRDSSGTNLGVVQSSTFPYTFITPANTVKVFFTAKTASDTDPTQIKLEEGPTAHAYTDWFKPYSGPKTGFDLQATVLAAGTQMAGKTVATTDQIGATTPFPTGWTKIAFIGSSITYGVGVSDYSTNGTNSVFNYRNIVSQTLNDSLARTIVVTNAGINGNNTANMLALLPSILTSATPQIVVIEASINDAQTTGVGQTVSQTRSNLTSMVNLVRNAGAIPVISVLTPIDMSVPTVSASFSQQKRSNVNAVAKDLAKTMNVKLIDVDRVSAQSLILLNDGLHPNNQGHLMVANVVVAELMK